MRAGESLVQMTPDQLKRIFDEGKKDWLSRSALSAVSDERVCELLNIDAYFEKLKLPLPTSQYAKLECLEKVRLIYREEGEWEITNFAAILLAKKLDSFPEDVSRKAPRFLIYEGTDKTVTKADIPGVMGYAVGFEGLVNRVHKDAPLNKFQEEVLRTEEEMFPKKAIRELIANALIHQDFEMTGMSVMIEMYADRLEISNPGAAPINVTRFIDEYRSRNESFAKMMRSLKICEEKGSGIDKVVKEVEAAKLPAPDFRTNNLRTTAILFAHIEFDAMSKSDRIRACYQHSCLLQQSNKKMSNQSLRDRFGLAVSKTALVSQVIAQSIEAKFIKLDEPEIDSTRYARYLPFWA
jgi:ATP-dependent DNA helicase RecG